MFSCLLASCSSASGKGGDRRPTPHYLLDGSYVDSDEVFDYYDIGNDEYAVSLKSSIKENYMGTGNPQTITIPNVHPTDVDLQGNPKKVTGIWHNAFYKNKAENIVFREPSNIETIDFEAFLYSSVTSITIPYTVNQIGDGAFYACSGLTKVSFENSNQKSKGSATECECTEDCVIDDEEEEEYIPSTLTVIPSLCFFKCNALADLSLPSSIEEIKEEAFNGCSSLSSPLFFKNIQIIRARAFQGCTSLLNVYISKSLFADADNIGIEPHAFNYCDPENLRIRFCATQEKIDAWETNHPNWGWYADREAPADHKYTYILESGETFFTPEWQYIVDSRGEITITKYTGAAPTQHRFISIPNKIDGHTVTRLDVNIFDKSVKQILKRIYLPTTLRAIENLMFKNDYNLLYVVDDNTACGGDYGKSDAQIDGRIDLSGITDLEFIGVRAFAGLGGSNLYNNKKAREYITSLHLPAKLRAVGGEAFGIFNNRYLPNVSQFIWDYSESDSILETIGTDAFYGLGISEGSGEIRGNATDYIANGGTIIKRKWHKASTIIFPKTFMHFGITSSDIARYKVGSYPFYFDQKSETPTKDARPAHAFIASSLLGKVVFKGSLDPSETCDLIIPLQTFVYNESLHTIIFEERKNHSITFHTQIGKSNKNGTGDDKYSDYAQESIGGNSGREKNDFRGEPFLQTLILPNKYTTLRLQSYAFHANARGVIYFTDDFDESDPNSCNVYGDAKCYNWKNEGFEDGPLTKAKEWKTIGDESYYNSKNNPRYYGYCFADVAATQSTRNDLNTFNIDQEMPVYTNIHYKDRETEAEVGVGNSKQLVLDEDSKCAFVCEKDSQNNYVATMSKYLYTIYDNSTGNQATGASVTTATIPETIRTKDENGTEHDYTVTKIGDSAFSSCFCDGQEFSPVKNHGDFDDLTTVVMPNTITSIGEYAFIRAYGIETIKSYSGNNTATERMPTSLRHIGKNAFLFSGIKKLLRIPYECLFYETENDVHDITSVFANAVDLRSITFDNQAGNDVAYASKYYEVTTYTSTSNGTRTTALYSKEYTGNDYSGETLYNGNRLLLVLNRDYEDNKKPSIQANPDATVNTSDDGIRFNGAYKNTEFLFGAYKMGYWIKELVFGKATTDGNGNTYTQPLFSAVGQRGTGETLTAKYFYLGINANNTRGNNILYENLTCDLTTIAGEVFSLPNYGMAGCENLLKTELSYKQNGVLPEGVFSEVTNPDTQYITPGPEGSTAHVLDLRDTGYIEISKDTFKKNNSIQKFIASNVSNFVIGESAFDSCANLQIVDLSAVTGNVTISKRAFANTPVVTIIWPSAPATVTINDSASVGGAFEDCTSLTNLTLPSTLTKLGTGAFKGCTSLSSVTVSGTISAVTTISDSAFHGCTSLATFEFSKFTNLQSIGGSAFYSTGLVNNNGNVELPGTVTSIGSSAFASSGIKTMTITSSSISLGASAFASCTSLTNFWFTQDNCAWNSYNASVFNGCTALVELQLPTGFNMSNSSYGGDTYFIQGDTNINIYVYEKFTINSNASDGWRRISNEVVSVHYFVEDVQELIDANVINSDPSVVNGSTQFWTTDANGHAINLGNVVSYDGTTVTFHNGSTLTGNVFVHS